MHDGGTDKIVRFFQNFYLQRFGDYFACHRGMSKDLENAIGPRLAVLEESPMSIPNVAHPAEKREMLISVRDRGAGEWSPRTKSLSQLEEPGRSLPSYPLNRLRRCST